MWILSDVWNSPEQKLHFRDGFLEDIINYQPYVHLDNAYVDVCSEGPLPCNGNSLDCKTICDKTRAHWIYSKSLLNIFLSPLHMKTVNRLLENKYFDHSIWIRPLIDTQKFRNQNIKRDIEYLYVGSITKYKGYDNIKNRFGHLNNFLFVGHNATNEKLFGHHIEYVPNHDIPGLLNRARNFVHLPVWIEPMGRTVVEAALCGCNILSNDNVGALSFPFDIADPEMIKGSARSFWNELLKRVMNKKNSKYCEALHG